MIPGGGLEFDLKEFGKNFLIICKDQDHILTSTSCFFLAGLRHMNFLGEMRV